MKSKLIAAALVTGLASPAAASTLLDFTSSSINASDPTGSSPGGTNFTVSASGGSLVDAYHYNDTGCSILACDLNAATGEYDVGFGVSGKPNKEEIDAGINSNEYVEVSFSSAVRILGFAGMLTYGDTSTQGGEKEQVLFEYSLGGGAWSQIIADPQFSENEGGGAFDTVGLAYEVDLNLVADTVRFFATGVGDGDDGTRNITAAALEVAPVPLPAAGWMLLAGLGGMAALRRRQKS